MDEIVPVIIRSCIGSAYLAHHDRQNAVRAFCDGGTGGRRLCDYPER